MPEYRGIVNPAEVKATPTFDWNTVIGNVQKSLTDSEAARQANRDKLEKDTNDTITAIGKVTLGKDEAMNTKLTEAAYNFKNSVGDYAKLVREGKASQKDFNMFNKNAMDTFSQIDAVGKNAKAAYDSYIAESKAGNLSAASDYMAQTLGLAASLKDKNIIMDPKSGRGFIAGQDPNDVIEVNWLNNEKNLLIPKVQLDKELDAQAKEIAAFTRVGRVGAGGIWTIDDATARKDFDLFENNVANGLTSNPLSALSVLTDYGDIKGQRYTPTINAEEAKKDPSKIFIQLNASGNPEPILTKEQDTAAKETAKRYLRERLKYEQKQVENTYRPPVFAPDRSGGGYKAGEEPTLSAPGYINKRVNGKPVNTGAVIGVENVRIKKSSSEDEVINNFGVDNGKFFMKFTRYTGKEGARDKDSGYFTSAAKKTIITLNGEKDASNINAKLALIPNPDTGRNFTGIDDAKDYIERHKKGPGFDADAYFRQQTKKK
jgi:hypothetical protein